MKHAFTAVLAICLLALAASCASSASEKEPVPEYFEPEDLERLNRFGGTYVPTGDGPLATKTPVDSIHFDKQRLDDNHFAEVFPALRRMDPRILSLDGHPVTDGSIERLNQLKSLKQLSLRNTKVTIDGLRKLDVGRLQSLHVSEEKFDEKALAEVKERVGRGDART